MLTRTEKAPLAPAGAPPELLELIRISRAAGADPDLVQGGGGNTSVKSRDGSSLFVKASGTALGEMDEARGWAEVDLAAARDLARREDLARLPADRRESEALRLLQAAVRRPAGARPSVEASLHAILGRVVIHTHPVGLNALLCSRRSREVVEGALEKVLEKVLENVAGAAAGPPLYVPYVDPGYTLAARLAREIDAYDARHGRRPSVVLLENHGVFVAAEEPEACLELHRAVTDAGRAWIGGARVNPVELPQRLDAPAGGGALAELRGALLAAGCEPCLLRRDDSPLAAELVSSPAALEVAGKGAFTPDQIVYCRKKPLVLSGASSAGWRGQAAEYRKRAGLDPRVVILPARPADGVSGGVFYAAPDLAQVRVVAEVYRSALAALLRTGPGGGPRLLTDEQAAFIEDWEVERFRGALLAGDGRRLAGRIGAVTGAGSGLGKGIAKGLARAGATVFGLDVSSAALEAARGELPAGRFVPAVADVTDEASVAAAFRSLEASLGGIDFLVNAAGIAPSHALVDFPLAAWRKTLEINLTGYFLCAREAARLLLRQGAGGSIINLTSKSGLEASKDNSAYNATKAGEIHLMRGWALELGRAGIRVNCVAPGNVFKGSRIWSEEYIEACAKKKGLRPEEVIPYYVSLSALGKEIEPEDIANAVVFLVSDEARNVTGQTLVVDGGQVMVR
ncbi:MAG: SDR family oxidoreductase [Planctomycetes bacterium]|nr:SDR family oxidoreductase [Planctomycetota bacterium]